MPFLTSESEWCELRFGANLLGGRGDGSVGIAQLAPMPPSALLLVRGEAAPVIRRLPSRVEIRVDGEVLGSAPMELYDGSHIQIAGCRLVFTLTAEGIVLPTAAPNGRASKEVSSSTTDAEDLSPWAFRELRTGRTIGIPKAGMLIGRSEECLLSVPGRGVSRRHAIVEPSPAGFAITDQSSNGSERHPPITASFLAGRYGPGIATVLLVSPGGVVAGASTANGWFAVWLPGPLPDRWSIRGLDAFGTEVANLAGS